MSAQRSSAPQVAPVSGLRKRYLEAAAQAPPVPRRKLLIPSNLDSTVTSSVIPGPDIEWNPSYATYQRRVGRLAASELNRPTCLPEGFPHKIEKPWAWTGSDFADASRYVVQLQETDILEIELALAFFKSSTDGNPGNVSRKTFPLTKLQERLKEVEKNIHLGFGFNVIRGLDPGRYSSLDNVLIYLGITSYVAEKRAVQDSSGNMLSKFYILYPAVSYLHSHANHPIVHVKDLGRIIPDSELRQSPYARNGQVLTSSFCTMILC